MITSSDERDRWITRLNLFQMNDAGASPDSCVEVLEPELLAKSEHLDIKIKRLLQVGDAQLGSNARNMHDAYTITAVAPLVE